MKNLLTHKKGETVTAFDAAARAMGLEPWREAKVLGHLYENDVWWYEVKFSDGGRQSILKPEGVKPPRSGKAVAAVKAMVQRAALKHGCPLCQRGVGESCVVRSRGVPQVVSERKEAHSARVAAAFAAGTIKIGEKL